MTTTEPATQLAHGQVHDVDPRTLAIASNVRETVVLHPEFVASVKEHGVLEPIRVYYADAETDQLSVFRGQRRTLAAIKAKRPLVPVLVGPPPTEAERIVLQMTENIHRDGMVAADVTAGVEQLALLGVSEKQLARGLAMSTEQVAAARAVTRSTTARAIAEENAALTLEHLAGIAEFDGDDEVVEALTIAAADGDYEHTLQRARDQRAEREAQEAFLNDARAQGYTIVKPASYGAAELTEPRRLTSLGDVDDPTTHAEQCPGHAWCLGYEWAHFTKDTGERLTPEQVAALRTTFDEAVAAALAANDEEARNEAQALHPTRVADYRRIYALEPCCANPAEYGHTLRGYGHDSGTPKGPMSDEEKAARRELIENNKAWKSATTVRRDWLSTLARTKAAPAGAEAFVLAELLRGGAHLTNALTSYGNGAGHQAFRDVMGLDREAQQTRESMTAEVHELLDSVKGMTAKRASLLLAVMVLAAWHHLAGPETWRHPSDTDRRMLEQMRAWGYPLSPIERRVLDEQSATGAPADVDEDDDDPLAVFAPDDE